MPTWSVVPGGIATPPRPHTFYLPAQQEEASVDVTVNDAISGPRADGPLLPVSQAAAVKSLGAGTAASADKRYCHAAATERVGMMLARVAFFGLL